MELNVYVCLIAILQIKPKIFKIRAIFNQQMQLKIQTDLLKNMQRQID